MKCKVKTSASQLTDKFQAKYARAQRLLDAALNQVGKEIAKEMKSLQGSIEDWIENIPSRMSEDEFYDAVAFLNEGGVGGLQDDAGDLKMFSEHIIFTWSQRQDAPIIEMRTDIIKALFHSYLTHGPQTAEVFIRDHVELGRWTPDVSLMGNVPKSVQREENGRWSICGIIFPEEFSWNIKTEDLGMANLSAKTVELIGDLSMYELLCRNENLANSTTLRRLQGHSGIGSRKAREIIDWLKGHGFEGRFEH